VTSLGPSAKPSSDLYNVQILTVQQYESLTCLSEIEISLPLQKVIKRTLKYDVKLGENITVY
jgi:hypothetical protein